ncbi:MAG: sulfite exporter TauE/SafE family protein [Methylophilaceae bacterium]|nr:sulfite exporter TauE/SafE family protein [Methylophilaceae bacterium]
MTPLDIFLFLLTGTVSGILSGLLGVGGGLIIVPILAILFSWMNFSEAYLMHMALGTSLATMITTSISSARAHHLRANVNWHVVKRIAPGVMLGALLGTLIAGQLNNYWLKVVFIAFIFCAATQLILNLSPNSHRQLPGQGGISLVGALIGMISSLVGIGGGTLSVPFLLYCNTDIRRAIGTSAAIGFPLATAGALSYFLLGHNKLELPPYSLGYIYLPALVGIALTSMLTAPIGAGLAQGLPILTLKRLFAILLYVIGLKMLWGIL